MTRNTLRYQDNQWRVVQNKGGQTATTVLLTVFMYDNKIFR